MNTPTLVDDEKAIVRRSSEDLQPIMSNDQMRQRYQAILDLTRSVLKQDIDFGIIPGTRKHTLLKPGAEKLNLLFGLRPGFVTVQEVEDWKGGFFFYRYKCQLLNRFNELVAEGIGSCNSREKKYRWRYIERKCPSCKKPTIRPGKNNSFFCSGRDGGCGQGFPAGDPRIIGQPSGREENTEPFDQVNTIDKMAQKRALIAATLIGTGASEFFTQDLEDFVDPSVVDPTPAPRGMAGDTQDSGNGKHTPNGHTPNGDGQSERPQRQPEQRQSEEQPAPDDSGDQRPAAEQSDSGLADDEVFQAEFLRALAGRPSGCSSAIATTILERQIRAHNKPDLIACDVAWRSNVIAAARGGLYDRSLATLMEIPADTTPPPSTATPPDLIRTEKTGKPPAPPAPPPPPPAAPGMDVSTWEKFLILWNEAAIARQMKPSEAEALIIRRLVRVGKRGKHETTTQGWRQESILALREDRINIENGGIEPAAK